MANGNGEKDCQCENSSLGVSYDSALLFPSNSVTWTIKLLSALFASSDGYCLGSAALISVILVSTTEPVTIAEVDGKNYELGLVAPGTVKCMIHSKKL